LITSDARQNSASKQNSVTPPREVLPISNGFNVLMRHNEQDGPAIEGVHHLETGGVPSTPVRDIVRKSPSELGATCMEIVESARKRVRSETDSVEKEATKSPRSQAEPKRRLRSQVVLRGRLEPKIDISYGKVIDGSEDTEGEEVLRGELVVLDKKEEIVLKISPRIRNIVIGESNVKRIRLNRVPKDTLLISIPGARFEEIVKVVHKIPKGGSLRNLILLGSMCNVDGDPTEEGGPIDVMPFAGSRLREEGVRVLYAPMLVDERALAPRQIYNLSRISNAGLEFFQHDVIPPIKRFDTVDGGIHYAEHSATAYFLQMLHFLE